MEKILDRKIKFIWDFKGPTAAKTAEHYEKHLQEYVLNEELKFDTTGFGHLSDMHSIAFLVVLKSEMKAVRDALKPHRGQIYSEN